jgi:hypothetical protein
MQTDQYYHQLFNEEKSYISDKALSNLPYCKTHKNYKKIYCKSHDIFYCAECEVAVDAGYHRLCYRNNMNAPLVLYHHISTLD